jgi:hypothetical protein
MKKVLVSFLFLSVVLSVKGQGYGFHDGGFLKQIQSSGYLHRPLPLDKANSMEALSMANRVIKKIVLSLSSNSCICQHQGLGQLFQDGNSLRLLVPVETGVRAKGLPNDSDYATFGSAGIEINLNGTDYSDFNRIEMDVQPVCCGSGVMNLNLSLDNGRNTEVGAHLINLCNNRWNHIVYDISGVRHDALKFMDIYTDIKGRNLFVGDSLVYYIQNISFCKTDISAKEKGWEPVADQIIYSMPGYLPSSVKTAILSTDTNVDTFELIDTKTGRCAYNGQLQKKDTSIGSYLLADFSAVRKSGSYYLRMGVLRTREFIIGRDIFVPSLWRVLNFIFCQRCGVEVSGIHGACHHDLMSVHEGKKTSYSGGWHDAGDLSQQTLQSGDVAFALAEEYKNLKKRQPDLARRMEEESKYGFRFVLQNRLGNGWHASSMGLLHWTDGIVGTKDDITSVRTQDNSFDNFLYAGYEAFAAMAFNDDKLLRDSLRRASLEDFDFAKHKFDVKGFDLFQYEMEHNYNTSQSLYMAVMSWSASQLYKMTGDKNYAYLATEYIKYVLDCQETSGTRPELNGFFYRDRKKQALVHFVHQSREQFFALALSELYNTQVNHPDRNKWREAIRIYGNYLKSLMRYTFPYDMLPSGTWAECEYRDSDGFNRLNLFAPTRSHELYDMQLRQGFRVDNTHYVRRFPIWFSVFNGNEAIILSAGKAAAVCGRLLNDNELKQIGLGQMYWTVGKNPFCQSLIYGEGFNYPSMDSFSSGEITGEIPVGIRTDGTADSPYWPQTNNACYKEVWMTSAGKWISLLAEY